MATNNSFDPPISSPPDRTPPVIVQPENRSVTQPWGAIPAVMNAIGKPGFALAPIEGKSDSGRGRRGARR